MNSKLFEMILNADNTNKDLEDSFKTDKTPLVTLVRASRKPHDIKEVMKARLDKPQSVKVTSTREVVLDDIIDDLSSVYDKSSRIEPTNGWTRFIDTKDRWPPIYVDSSGYDYCRYTGIAHEDLEDWKVAIDEFY